MITCGRADDSPGSSLTPALLVLGRAPSVVLARDVTATHLTIGLVLITESTSVTAVRISTKGGGRAGQSGGEVTNASSGGSETHRLRHGDIVEQVTITVDGLPCADVTDGGSSTRLRIYGVLVGKGGRRSESNADPTNGGHLELELVLADDVGGTVLLNDTDGLGNLEPTTPVGALNNQIGARGDTPAVLDMGEDGEANDGTIVVPTLVYSPRGSIVRGAVKSVGVTTTVDAEVRGSLVGLTGKNDGSTVVSANLIGVQDTLAIKGNTSNASSGAAESTLDVVLSGLANGRLGGSSTFLIEVEVGNQTVLLKDGEELAEGGLNVIDGTLGVGDEEVVDGSDGSTSGALTKETRALAERHNIHTINSAGGLGVRNNAQVIDENFNLTS